MVAAYTHMYVAPNMRSHKLELQEWVGRKLDSFILQPADDRTPTQLNNIYLYIHTYVCTVGT